MTISNNKKQECKGTIKAVKEYNEIRAKFVAGFPSLSPAWSTPSWYQLNEATVKLDNRDTLQFGGNSVLIGDMVYNVERTSLYNITATATIPAMIAYALNISANQKMETSSKHMGYNTTLEDILKAMLKDDPDKAALLQAMVSKCERTSPSSNWSVDYNKIADVPKNYEFTIVREGKTDFDMTGSYSGVDITIPVSIKVEKMTSSTE